MRAKETVIDSLQTEVIPTDASTSMRNKDTDRLTASGDDSCGHVSKCAEKDDGLTDTSTDGNDSY
jgi:hypothetical protein